MMEENRIWKGVRFYTEEIEKAGIRTPYFSDILTGKEPPKGNPKLLFENITLDGKRTDIYDFGGGSGRLYLHIKD